MIIVYVKMLGDEKFKNFLKVAKNEIEKIHTETINEILPKIKDYAKSEIPKDWNITDSELKSFKMVKATGTFFNEASAILKQKERIPFLRLKEQPEIVAHKGIRARIQDTTNTYFADLGKKRSGAFRAIPQKRGDGFYQRITNKYYIDDKGNKKNVIVRLKAPASPEMARSKKTGFPDKVTKMVENTYDTIFTQKVTDLMSRMGIK